MPMKPLRGLASLAFAFLFSSSALADEVQVLSSPTGKVLGLYVEEDPAPVLPAEIIDDGTGAAPAQASSATTGKPSPRSAPLRTPTPAPRPEVPDPVGAAQEFLVKYGSAFGMKNVPDEVTLYQEEGDALGFSHLRFRNEYKGIPVLGGELVVHVNKDSKVKSVNGNIATNVKIALPKKLAKIATLAKAAAVARKAFRAEYPKVHPELKKVKLQVVQPALLEPTSTDTNSYLAWEIDLKNDTALVNESYFVDTASGKIIFTLDHVQRLNRRVYDCSALPGSDACGADYLVNATIVPTFAAPPTQYAFGCRDAYLTTPCPHGPNPRYDPRDSYDSDNLFELLGEVHNYYQTKFNRNGANGQGGNTNGSVFSVTMDAGRTYLNWLSNWYDDCLEAIFWSDRGTGFCKGLVVDDIVAHEYSHGINYYTPYFGQSGALQESNSDIMGEMFEYYLTGTNDWLGGADAPGLARNFADPSSVISFVNNLPFPDRFYSGSFYCGTSNNNGIHVNSTVPSKALYLASVGGAFNGCSISAIGRDKVEQILYRTNTQYYSGTPTFNSAYNSQIQACVDLYGAGSETCTQLARALQAVEMDQIGLCSDPTGAQARPATCACTDTDDWKGLGLYAQQGGAAGTINYNGKTYKDYCVLRKNVVEQFCDKGVRKQALIYCPNGCTAGKCN